MVEWAKGWTQNRSHLAASIGWVYDELNTLWPRPFTFNGTLSKMSKRSLKVHRIHEINVWMMKPRYGDIMLMLLWYQYTAVIFYSQFCKTILNCSKIMHILATSIPLMMTHLLWNIRRLRKILRMLKGKPWKSLDAWLAFWQMRVSFINMFVIL